jgi:hypothetical protein
VNRIANEVEIVITAKNRATPGMAAARADARKFGAELKQTLGKAGAEAGAALGEGIVAGADGKLRDAKGRFVKGVLPEPAETERQGRGIGRRIAGAMGAGIKGAVGALRFAVGGAVEAAVSKPMLVGILLAALGGVAAVLGPALGTLIAGSLVLGVGGAVAGIGVALLAEDKKIKKQWTQTWTDLKKTMREAAEPLRPVLDTARKTLKSVVGELAPEIEKGLQDAQKPMQRFIEDLGKGFKNLAPAIGPLFESFGDVLDEIGPQLPGIFENIANSMITLATTVSENRDLFALLFAMLLNSIPLVINLVSVLAGAFRGALSTFLGFTDGLLSGIQTIMEAVAQIPGPWQEAARAAVESIGEARNQIQALKGDVDSFPRRIELEGQITDLEAKIATAKARLRDPKLTRPEKAAIRAEISQLQSQVRTAKAELASIRNRNVVVTVTHRDIYLSAQRTQQFGFGYARAHGGIVGSAGMRRFAQGGVAGAGSSMALVGEQGPELVSLPVGSTVRPAGQTRAMLSGGGAGGGGFGSISMAFRQAASSGGGLDSVAGGLQEVARALREIVTLRDGLGKLTDTVFGQTRALMAYEEAWDAAQKALKENGRTLNITTQKGRENRGSLLSLAEAAHEVVIAMREKGSSIDTVTKKMKEQRAEFIRMARSFGLTSKEAAAMADRLGLIPSQVKKILEKEKTDVAYNKAAEKYNAKLDGKASGGITGGWTLTGERGPELIRLPFGSSVVPAGQTAAMMAGGGGTSGEMHITLKIGEQTLGRIVINPLRREIRSLGGNVQAALGSG